MGQVDVMILLHNLTQLLAQERNKLLDGMEDQLRWYYNQFEVMLGFLTDNEEMYDEKHLPKEVAELAHRTEDVVDTYYRRYKRAHQEQQPFVLLMDHTGNLKKDIEGMIERIGGLPKQEKNKKKEEQKNTKKIEMSGSSSSRFQYDSRREKAVQMLNQSLPRTIRGWVADPESDWIVVNKEHCDGLVDQLINEGPPKELDFIAIEGDMGPFMINVIKKVYNDALVRDHFDSRAWVLVPEKGWGANMRNFLLSILIDIMVITPREIYEMEEWELKKEVLKQLIGIRYLIVLQDTDPFSGHCRRIIEDVIPKSKNGSRIIVAIRNVSMSMVSRSFDEKFYIDIPYVGDPPYTISRDRRWLTLRYESTETYWKVFWEKIIGGQECPEELENLARRIGESHLSLSLIVQFACILRVGEKTVSRWSNMDVGGYYEPEKFLSKCYHEMPQHLKTCFLYLCVFPKGFEISVKQLIRLWIAEGLIQWVEESTNNNTANKQHKQARSIEDVAEKDHLEGLIGLNFIHVTSTRSDGGPKSCRIRPFEWDFYSDLSSEKNFVHFHPDRFGRPRRLSIAKDCESLLSYVDPTYEGSQHCEYFIDDLDSNEKSDTIEWRSEPKTGFVFCCTRTLSCFDQEETKIVSEETWESIFKYAQLLRVLNLGEVEVGKLPQAMEKLFHMRYLSVKPTKNIVVPKSIFKLWNLQTIDLRTTQFSELPEGIWKMQQLRHLYLSGDGPSRLPIPENEDCILPNLQTLSFISIDPDDGIHIGKRVPNLRKLGLCDYECFSVGEERVTFDLQHLRTIKFARKCNFEVAITLPDTITKISTVKEVYLQQNVIEMFGKLSNLQVLKLVETSFDDGELVFGKGSFPQLQLLKFEASNIVTWRLEDRTMPKLHRLIINNCPQLTELPIELWKVNTLQELDLSQASMKFAKKVEDHLKGKEGLEVVITFPLSSKSGA